MERSSGQNSPKNVNDSQTQLPQEEEIHEDDNREAPKETPESSKSTKASEGNKSDVASGSELLTNVSNTGQNVTDSETDSQELEEKTTINSEVASTKNLPVVMAYAARERPRQPFYGGTSTSGGQGNPPPPSPSPARGRYFVGGQQQISNVGGTSERGQQQPASENQARPHQYRVQERGNPLNDPMVNPFTNIVVWAPYPTKIPTGVPTHLAHLVDAEVAFVVQHLEAIEFFGNIDLPNLYLIQNKNGECIYYVYESTVCIPCCCKNSRALQLHVMDMYQQEVIFMNKSCGCALYFCCFPVLEVYSPPSVPVGAVIKRCKPCREQFTIVDADENLLFKIYGDCTLMYCCRCLQYDFVIRALDSHETEVGYIRRDFPGINQFFLGAEFYGVSFPADMDVRIKAVFLGALFLIDFLYFE